MFAFEQGVGGKKIPLITLGRERLKKGLKKFFMYHIFLGFSFVKKIFFIIIV
jgi:hypothetical protein